VSDLYGSFAHLERYRVEAWMPSNRDEPRQWMVKVFRDDVLLKQQTIPMDHDPIFGVDVDDVAQLNESVDVLLAELPTT